MLCSKLSSPLLYFLNFGADNFGLFKSSYISTFYLNILDLGEISLETRSEFDSFYSNKG